MEFEKFQKLKLSSEELKQVREQLEDSTTYEFTEELMNQVMNKFPIEEDESLTLLDRILWTLRGGYIIGFMSAIGKFNPLVDAFTSDLNTDVQKVGE